MTDPGIVTDPPVYVFYAASDHARLRMGLELSASLLASPILSVADRQLAIDELHAVIEAMGG